jgi:hypothetical protein
MARSYSADGRHVVGVGAGDERAVGRFILSLTLSHRSTLGAAAGKVGRTVGASETPNGPFPSTEVTVAKDNSQIIAIGVAAP